MKHFILSIDPGNNAGVTYGFSDEKPTSTVYNFTPKKATKTHAAEPEHKRYGNLLNVITQIVNRSIADIVHREDAIFDVTIICEGAAGFSRGKAAIEVSNQYRGVVKAYAAYKNHRFVPIQPADLQKFATGKGRAEKTEVLQVAKERYGYTGVDDNESDSLIMWHFVKEQLERS